MIAKERALLNEIKPVIDELRRTGFHMSDELYHELLISANEVAP